MNKRTPSVLLRVRQNLTASLGWLIPGLGVKRWLILILLGTTLLGVGLGVVLLDIYRTSPDTWFLPLVSAISLRFLPRPARALIFGGLGMGVVLFGIWELNRTLMLPFQRPGRRMVDTLRLHRQRERGPRIVALGGGHGQAGLLRGLKTITHNLTAIVTVADDGGSSGRLRRELGIPPPGDIRNCLAALSDDEALLSQLFQYRFPDLDAEEGGASRGGLEGHSFGNLFISALVEITGSFEEAVAESGRVLAVHGRVLPATLHNVRLEADVQLAHAQNEVRVVGESQIPQQAGRIRRVWLEPSSPPAFPQAIQALLAADLIVIGPGSLYTSILPNLLVPDLAAAVRASRALKIYVCNVASQEGETDHFTCGDHVRALLDHLGPNVFDVVLCNNRFDGILPAGVNWVAAEKGLERTVAVRRADLIDVLRPWRHDSNKLAQTILELLQEKSGHLVE
jgi:uncharacterized cofD-like protein